MGLGDLSDFLFVNLGAFCRLGGGKFHILLLNAVVVIEPAISTISRQRCRSRFFEMTCSARFFVYLHLWKSKMVSHLWGNVNIPWRIWGMIGNFENNFWLGLSGWFSETILWRGRSHPETASGPWNSTIFWEILENSQDSPHVVMYCMKPSLNT